jgi:hypothetical protein
MAGATRQKAEATKCQAGAGRNNREGRLKDTANNIFATKEFVVSLVSEAMAEAMNITCIDAPPDTDDRAKQRIGFA